MKLTLKHHTISSQHSNHRRDSNLDLLLHTQNAC